MRGPSRGAERRRKSYGPIERDGLSGLGLDAGRTPRFLACRAMRFVGQYAFLGGATSAAFLAAGFLALGPLLGRFLPTQVLDPGEQKVTGEEPVEPLLTARLALDLDASRTMVQHDTGGCLVDVLPARPAGTYKRFVEVCLRTPTSASRRAKAACRSSLTVAALTAGHGPSARRPARSGVHPWLRLLASRCRCRWRRALRTARARSGRRSLRRHNPG